MTSVLARSRKTSDTSITVKYTPCAKTEPAEEEDLEEIAIVSKNNERGSSIRDQNDSNQSHESRDSETVVTANGPRILSNLGPFQSPSDRTKLIGERLSSSGTGVINISSPVYSGKIVEQKSKSTSKQSLLEIVSTKLDRVKQRNRQSRDEGTLMNKTRSSETVTSKGIRKLRRKEIVEKFGKKSQRFDHFETSTTSTEKDGCKWTFVFDPSGRLCYWWSAVVGIAFLYNFWVIIYRYAFQEIDSSNIALWFTLDYSADLLYVLDIAFHFRTGYLDEGVLQTDSTKLRIHYMNSAMFYIDCLCLLPLDFLYLSIGFYSLLRGFRLVKVYRFWAFLDRTERHTNFPNFIRTCSLVHYLLALFHWNACLYKIVLGNNNATSWAFPEDDVVLKQYLHALYWSTLTFTNVGGLPSPTTIEDYLFAVFELICGLLLFATVLGHIANIVASVSAARKEFQARLDGVKTYMTLRRVPLRLQDRVIKWFDYLWMSNKSADEEKTLSLLPDKLKAEIAIHVHLDTLKRVEIFQKTEAGFLCELVLRLRPVLFSPGDYICRKGEVGKDMYIVNRGRLHVVADNGKTVLATLKPGSYFGEISILNMGTAGNRRTASVRSVGYSDLFCLSKQDLWDVLKEYPAARVKLEAIAVKRLEKYKKQPLEKAAISRSKSTPGLVESAGKIPLEAMFVARHHTLPAGLIQQARPTKTSPTSSESNLRAKDGQDGILLQTTSEPTLHQGEDFDQVAVTVITNSASTVAAVPTDSTPQRSPLPSEGTCVSFTPPLSPRQHMSAEMSATNILNISATLPSALPGHIPRMSVSPSPDPGSPYHQPTPHVPPFPPTPTHLSPYATPYCGSSYPPSPSYLSGSTTFASLSTQPSHQLAAPPGVQIPIQQGGYHHLSGSVSPVTPSRDPSHEILLQEITRLRERLVTLETENASMSIKLNQQQWEVQHRLAEIEMHICGSESPGSTASGEDAEKKCEPTNKESVI